MLLSLGLSFPRSETSVPMPASERPWEDKMRELFLGTEWVFRATCPLSWG